jgi:hypothetical protein
LPAGLASHLFTSKTMVSPWKFWLERVFQVLPVVLVPALPPPAGLLITPAAQSSLLGRKVLGAPGLGSGMLFSEHMNLGNLLPGAHLDKAHT